MRLPPGRLQPLLRTREGMPRALRAPPALALSMPQRRMQVPSPTKPDADAQNFGPTAQRDAEASGRPAT